MRSGVIITILLIFTIFSTSLLLIHLDTSGSTTTSTTTTTSQGVPSGGFTVRNVLFSLESSSPVTAPASWILLVGALVWRRRFTRNNLGLDRETFRLMMGMKGSRNREKILRRLASPKDRFQLANDLGMDWKTADYHINLLLKYALIQESVAYGKVRLYQLTENGELAIKALDKMNLNFAYKNQPKSESIQGTVAI